MFTSNEFFFFCLRSGTPVYFVAANQVYFRIPLNSRLYAVLRTERQWCDVAMSLSLLSMCERGFKRLQECWECYSDKLTEPGVYQPLLSITAKLRRGAKLQFKVSQTPVSFQICLFSGSCKSSRWIHFVFLRSLVSGSGGGVWKASNSRSHPGLRECGKSWDGWGEPKRRRAHQEDGRKNSQRPSEIKKRSGFTAVVLMFPLLFIF